MSLTLVEAMKTMKDPVQQAIVKIYAESVDILRVLPFRDIAGGAYRYNREEALPGIGFRGVNEAWTDSTGVINPMVEPLVIAGGELKVDRFIIETQGMQVRSDHEAMKVKALAHRWAHTFIKGDSITNPKEFDGLQIRLTGNQKIAAGSTSGGDALSLSKLDQLIDAVDSPTHLLMSLGMRRLLTSAARNPSVSGYITYDKDAFGRRVMMYNDLPILIADENASVYKTLAFDEANPGGGSAVGTSIYCLSMGSSMLEGIQTRPPMVDDLGLIQASPHYLTRVEWYNGMTLTHPRAAARLWGIKNAAVVA